MTKPHEYKNGLVEQVGGDEKNPKPDEEPTGEDQRKHYETPEFLSDIKDKPAEDEALAIKE